MLPWLFLTGYFNSLFFPFGPRIFFSGIGALAYATKAPAVAPAPTTGGTTIWAQGFGGWTNLDGNANASSVSESIGGIISGADIRAGDWRIGAALGYSQSNANVDAVASSTEVNSMLLALYAGTTAGPWNLRLGASYAFNQIDATRTIAFPGVLQRATAQYDGGTAQVFGEIGYGFALQSIALEPFAGLAYVQLNTDSFAETGLVAPLSGASASSGVGYSSLGLRAATRFALSNGMVLAPHASAAWQYAFGDVDPTAQLAFRGLPGSNFTVGGVPLAQNTALLEVGVDLNLSAQARVGLSYVGQFADGVTTNAFQANLAWRF